MPSPEPPPQSPAPPPPPPQHDLDGFVLVFAGSSPEDVSHARQLWSSLSLMPPRESRLASADISQRLPVSRPQRSGNAASGSGSGSKAPEPPSLQALQQRQEEKQRYLSMAIQRREIMALLRRQRERRVQKELLSREAKEQKTRNQPRRSQTPESKVEEEMVQQLE